MFFVLSYLVDIICCCSFRCSKFKLVFKNCYRSLSKQICKCFSRAPFEYRYLPSVIYRHTDRMFVSLSSRMGIFALHQSSLPKLVVNSQKQKYFQSYISKLHWKKNNYHHADIHNYVYVPNTNLGTSLR